MDTSGPATRSYACSMNADPKTADHHGDEGTSGPADGQSGRRGAPASLIFDDPLSRPSGDDTDRGWGEGTDGRAEGADADLRRFLDEKPPHHI